MPGFAYSHDGVKFGGNGFLWNPLIDDGVTPLLAPQFVLSYWYNSQQNANFATILASYPYYSTLNNYNIGIHINHQNFGTSKRFFAYLTDGQTTNFQQWMCLEPLPYDGNDHHICFMADTNQIVAKIAIDGVLKAWDPIHSTWGGNVFDTLANGSAWSIAANINRLTGLGQDFYNGSIHELYGHFAAGDYDSLTTPGGVKQGFVQRFTWNPGTPDQEVIFGPLDLGPGCSAVFGAMASPLICQRGNPAQFIKTSGANDFITLGVGPITAPTSPFNRIP